MLPKSSALKNRLFQQNRPFSASQSVQPSGQVECNRWSGPMQLTGQLGTITHYELLLLLVGVLPACAYSGSPQRSAMGRMNVQ
ncbi:hypothetical protein PSEUDO9AZ_12150 [Pseudomonas sp. 9AZ]|nr:hypothetical protein PSEUDO9AZ_12150 [Pseudomonas sp. 9AZ]